MRAAVALWLLALAPNELCGQLSAFHYDSTRVPVGRVSHYIKSNRDGSHQGRISVYVTTISRLESLKWEPGATEATLVVADLDWRTFSVRRFDAWHLARGAADDHVAWLVTDSAGTTVRSSFTGNTAVPVARLPWHSYDFDFISLGHTLPHLRDPESGFVFERADVVFKKDTRTFADFGAVQLRFVRTERHTGRPARLYTIGGPGLEHTTGSLWTDARTGALLEFQLPIPDEPGYRDGRLSLDRVENMAPREWAAYKRQRVGER